MPKRLQLLKQLVPRAVRVAVLVDPNTQFGVMAMPDNQLAASKLGLRLETFEVRSSTDLDAAFARIRDSRSDAVALIPEPLLFVQRARIAELALKNRLPLVADHRWQAEAGAVLVYNWSLPEVYRQAAKYVDQILKGARPADLPVQDPATFELIINRKTARAIGLKVPQSLLDRADRVIE